MADLGFIRMSDDMAMLNRKCLSVVARMGQPVWQDNPGVKLPDGKTLDSIMLKVQSQASKDGMNNVWAEKLRLLAKPAVMEQWKRRQKNPLRQIQAYRHAEQIRIGATWPDCLTRCSPAAAI